MATAEGPTHLGTGPIDGPAEPAREQHRNVFFASPPDVPRVRRPVDVAILAVALVITLLVGSTHEERAEVDTRVLEFFKDGLPGWLNGIAGLVFALGGLYSLALVVGIAVFGRGRLSVARDMVVAMALTVGLVVVSALATGPELPDVFPEWWDIGYPSFPVGRLSVAVAAIRVAEPYLSLPMRRVGHRLVFATAISALVLTYGTVSGVVGGLALGAASAAMVHLIFGSGAGIPSRARIEAALREAHLDVVGVEFLPVQPFGATLVRAELADGEPLLVKMYGRDAADARLAARIWRAMWYRSSGRALFASSGQIAEHESLIMLACERLDLPVPRLVTWARATTDDTLVIARWVDGTRLSHLNAAMLDDGDLDRAWAALGAFHAAGFVHTSIDGDRVLVTDDDVLLTELADARILATDDDRGADAAQLLVALAISAGEQRAVDAARRNLGDDGLLRALPFLQPAALPRELQRQTKSTKVSVADLRNLIVDDLGAEPPELVQLQRVSWGSVVMAALTLFAASSLISSLTDIGFDTIAEELANASWAWVVVALVLAQLTNVGEYVTLVGVIGSPIPFGPTIMFRYALSFISLAVPSEAGAIAMNIRYQQKLGVPPAAAVAQGPLITIVSKGFDVVLLLLTATFVGRSFDTDEVDLGAAVKLVVLVVIVAVVAVVVVLAVPKLRASMLPHVREGFAAVRGSLTDPDRLMRLVGGTVMQKILFALTLSASVSAFTSSISFSEAVFVNSAVSLFVGLVPVPGGIGVGEAALTAGLIAVGVPEEAAFAAALTHRIVTSYLPPMFGWWAARWLTQRDYL